MLWNLGQESGVLLRIFEKFEKFNFLVRAVERNVFLADKRATFQSDIFETGGSVQAGRRKESVENVVPRTPESGPSPEAAGRQGTADIGVVG